MGNVAGQVLLAVAVKVLLTNPAGVPPDVMARAKAVASRVYSDAAIELQWIDDVGEPIPASEIQVAIIVALRPNPESRTHVAPDVMGTSTMTASEKGTIAYAFYSRIVERARNRRIDPAVMLGYVIAHEMGHLLLGHASHSPDGIMRARWDQFEQERFERDSLKFTKEQAAAMRGNVKGR